MSVCGSLHRAIVVGCQNGDHRPSQCSCRSSSSSRSLKCCSYYRGTLTPATFSTIAATSQVTKFAVAATSTTATAAAAAYYATSIDAFTTNTTALFRTSASLTFAAAGSAVVGSATVSATRVRGGGVYERGERLLCSRLTGSFVQRWPRGAQPPRLVLRPSQRSVHMLRSIEHTTAALEAATVVTIHGATADDCRGARRAAQ